MKRLFFITILAITILSFSVEPVNALSKLHVDGKYLKNETNHIIELRGVFKHGFEDFVGGFWKDESGTSNWFDESKVIRNLDVMHQWGANEVRTFIRVDWWLNNSVDPNSGLSYRDCIKRLIQLADERGMYVTISFFSFRHTWGWHNVPWGTSVDPANFSIYTDTDFANLWRDVADELKVYPNVQFELWNEVADGEGRKNTWLTGVQKAITAIREVTDHIVVVQWGWDVWYRNSSGYYPGVYTIDWAADPRIHQYENGTRFGNILISTHMYAQARGFIQTTVNQTDADKENWYYFHTYDEILTAFEEENIPDLLNGTGAFVWLGHGLPLYIGEFGTSDPEHIWPPNELEAVENALTILDGWGVNYNLQRWWIGCLYCFFTETSNRIYYDDPSYITEWGQIGKNHLLQGEGPTTTTTTTSTTSTTTTTPTGQVSISGQLRNASGLIEANVYVYNQGTSEVNNSQTISNGVYDISVWPGTYDLRYNILHIPNFFIKLISLIVNYDLYNPVNEVNKYENTVSFKVNITEDQEIQVYSEQEPKTIKVNGMGMTRKSSRSGLTANEWFYNSSEKRLYLIANPNLPTTTTTTMTSSTTTSTTGTTSTTTSTTITTTISTTTTVPSGYILQDGFEDGTFNSWTSTPTSSGGSASVDSNDPYQGINHANFTVNANPSQWAYASLSTTQSTVYARAYMKFSALPTSGAYWYYEFRGSDSIFNFRVVDGGSPRWQLTYLNTTGQSKSASSGPSLNTWYCIELYGKVGDGTDGEATLYINGVPVVNVTNIDSDGNGDITKINMGIRYLTGAQTVLMDDVIIDDTYIGC